VPSTPPAGDQADQEPDIAYEYVCNRDQAVMI